MAVLAPEFRHDLFISYGRGDADQTGNTPLITWSAAFAHELEDELRIVPSLKGSEVFFDASCRPGQRLDPSDPLTEQLRRAISESALLLILMSPHYLDSDWCRDERGWWGGQLASDNNLDVNRTIIARIWPTDDVAWPTELCDQRGHPPRGFWFHPNTGDPNTRRPFGGRSPGQNRGSFDAFLLARGPYL